MMTTEKRSGTKRFAFADLVAIRIRKRVRCELKYKSWLSTSTRQMYWKNELQETWDEIKQGRIKPIKWRRERLYDVDFLLKDGTRVPCVTIMSNELPAFLEGKVQFDGFRRTYQYQFGSFEVLEFDTDGDGTYTKHVIYVPYKLLRDVLRRAAAKTYDFQHLSVLYFPITERHRRFFQPHGKILWHEGAEEVYTKHQDDPAGGGQTLKDSIEHLLQIARNYSADKSDPVTLNLAKEDEKSFYFWFTDKGGRRRAYNGGVIWHDRSGEYGMHT